MVNLSELINKLKSGEIPSTSKLDLINEKRQEIPKGANISKFSYEFQKNSRVLFRLQMALPFDPVVGEATAECNPEKKWRPPFSPTTSAKLIKHYAKENSATKELLMARSGIGEWDVSDPETLNEQDFKVLHAYRVPLVVTAEAVTINDPAITGKDFGVQYSVPVKRDLQTGQILGEIPAVAKIGQFMSAVTYAEIKELEAAINTKDPSKYKAIRAHINNLMIAGADDKVQREWVSGILNRAIISSVRPKNFLMAFEFKLSSSKTMVNEERKPLPVFTNTTPEDLKGKQIYFDYVKKYKELVTSVLSKPHLDHFWDFIEVDICDSCTTEPKDKQEKAEARRALAIATPAHSFWNVDENRLRAPWVGDLLQALSEFVDSDPTFEEKMALFMARQLRPLDDTVVNMLTERVADKVPLSYRYVTDDIMLKNRDACLLIYGESFTDALIERKLLDPPEESTEENAVEAEKDVNALINDIIEDEDEDELPDVTTGMGAEERPVLDEVAV